MENARRRGPLLLIGLGVALLLAQLAMATAQSRRLVASEARWGPEEQRVLRTRPFAAEVVRAGTGESLGWTPLALPEGEAGALILRRPGYQARVDLSGGGQDLALLQEPVRLGATIPGLSPLLFGYPLLGAGLLLAGLGIALEVPRRARQRDLDAALAMPARVAPGGRLGRYLIEAPLGEGGMAEVFLARPLDGRGGPVALKVLREDIAENEQFRLRYLREVRICLGLRHPGLVSLLDAGEEQGRLFQVMELMEGSLTQRLRPEGLPVDEVRQIGIDLAEALDYAHGQGVIHRDLKPDNLMLGPDGRVRIADFGLARSQHFETLTATGTALGTPAYMPPEQVGGDRADPRADLYSVGCILYQLLTGQPPFDAADPLSLLMRHLSDAPEPPSALRPGIPPDLEAIVLRLLQKEPDDRFASARDLRAALTGGPGAN